MKSHNPSFYLRFLLAACCIGCGSFWDLSLGQSSALGQAPSRSPQTGREPKQQIPKRTGQPTVAPPNPNAATPKSTVQANTAKQATSSIANGLYDLRHKLKAGELVRTKNIHVVNTVTRIQGVDDFSESRTVSEKIWEIKSVNREGHITLEYRIESVDMSQKKGDDDEVKYNSLVDKEVPPIFSAVAETIAKPVVVVTIDPFGTIIERDSKSKLPPIGMGELATPLPKEPVAIGAQWSIPHECRVKQEDGTQKSIKIREQYTLEKVSAGIATIRVQSVPITPVEEPSVEVQLMQQLSSGTVKFDIDTGRMISKQLDWNEDVVGFAGADSSLKYNSRFTEELLVPAVQSANKPSPAKKKR